LAGNPIVLILEKRLTAFRIQEIGVAPSVSPRAEWSWSISEFWLQSLCSGTRRTTRGERYGAERFAAKSPRPKENFSAGRRIGERFSRVRYRARVRYRFPGFQQKHPVIPSFSFVPGVTLLTQRSKLDNEHDDETENDYGVETPGF
jgi:hypothetical protein